MAQTVNNEPAHHRMIAVHDVATAAEIIVVAIRRQHVIDIVINALEAEARSHLISFCRVVEHNIQNDLDAIFLELANQAF